jgi:hypothetical protein
MVACIVENVQIDQALAAQDEEEKQSRLLDDSSKHLNIKAQKLTPEPDKQVS